MSASNSTHSIIACLSVSPDLPLDLCSTVDVGSSELVERLLNDLLKTTEGYQTLKNQLEIHKHENSLNEQALMPLQKENERVTKENNKLHLEIITVKE